MEAEEGQILVRDLLVGPDVQPFDLLGEAHVLRGASRPHPGPPELQGGLPVRPGLGYQSYQRVLWEEGRDLVRRVFGDEEKQDEDQ